MSTSTAGEVPPEEGQQQHSNGDGHAGSKRPHEEEEEHRPEGGGTGGREDEGKEEEGSEPSPKRTRTDETAQPPQHEEEAQPPPQEGGADKAGVEVASGGYVGYSGGGYSASAAVDYATGAGVYEPYAPYAPYDSSAYGGYAGGYDGAQQHQHAAAGAGAQASSTEGASSAAAAAAPIPDSLSPDPPSKVLHFRNVTAEITQEDIMEMAAPFGTVERVVMLSTKNQALLEFSDLSSAILMSNFYINTQPNIRGRKVYMRFSRHQQLTASTTGPNRILLVTLQTDQEPIIPITADIIWQIFSSYGFIEKIVVMNKQAQEYSEDPRRDSRLQTLVQFSSPVSAQTASQYLNGKTVYVGTDPIMSITLFIQYSHLAQLTVKHNSASARDYITPLPWGHQHQQPYAPHQSYGAPAGGGYGYPPMHPPYGGYM